jgi:hypothetical protein
MASVGSPGRLNQTHNSSIERELQLIHAKRQALKRELRGSHSTVALQLQQVCIQV